MHERWRWRAPLISILAMSFGLNSWAVTSSGWGAAYYAAAVRSMGMNRHNFFFASFDPTGYVSVDKPPLSLWIQVLFTKVFGYHPIAVFAPQVLAGTAAVALLAFGLRRAAGRTAGLIGALALTITPISVMVNRSNDTDGVLIFLMTAAAVATMEAVRSGRLRWLVGAALLGGSAITAKMLAGAPVLPGILLAYAWCAPRSAKVRAAHVGVATLTIAAAGLWWFAAVEATPSGSRPYVGSTQKNSVFELAFERNGVNQVEGASGFGGGSARNGGGPRSGGAPGRGGGAGGSGGVTDQFGLGFSGGQPGPLRLLNRAMGTQAGWLIPLAALGALSVLWASRLRPSRQLAALIVFAGWAAIDGYFISVTKGLIHPYYLAAIGPPIAALAGLGAGQWRSWLRTRHRGGLLLSAALLITAVTQHTVLTRFQWRRWLAPTVVSLMLMAAVLVVLAVVSDTRRMRGMGGAALAAGLVAPLLAPALWVQASVANGMNAALPYAVPFSHLGGGPAQQQPGGVVPNGGFQFPGGDLVALVKYLRANRPAAADPPRAVDVTVPSAAAAESLIIRYGISAVPVGGFIGGDPITTSEALRARIKSGRERFFLLATNGGGFNFGGGGPGGGFGGPAPAAQDGRFAQGGGLGPGPGGFGGNVTAFVRQDCAVIPTSEWQPKAAENPGSAPTNTFQGGPSAAAFTLFDCRSPAS